MDDIFADLVKLPTPKEMNLWDKAAIEFGIPETILMENAGCAIAKVVQAKFGNFAGKTICLFMGGGNNGGDAACIARHIQDAGGQAIVFCMKEPAEYSGAPGWHLALAKANGAIFAKLNPASTLADFLAAFCKKYGKLPDLVVDALLGTGFSGALKANMAAAINLLNNLARAVKAPVVAVDIPSGLDAITGRPAPPAIRACLTVTLAAAKPGLLLPCAKEWTGQLVCHGIGIPKTVLDACPASFRLIDGHCLKHLPALPANSYKNIFGHVYVLGGACGYAGAAHLACAAALRAGAGLVTACAPQSSLTQIKGNWPEIMTLPVASGASWPDHLPQNLQQELQTASALIIGPGMSRKPDAAQFLSALLSLPNRPSAVIDADALALIAANSGLWEYLSEQDILTPHPGEAAMLLNRESGEIQKNRFQALDELCARTKSVIVLKGAGTIIGQGTNMRLICPYDIPQLAIGGAGDVLAGCIGALAGSQIYAGIPSIMRAAFGVTLHALAGLHCSRKFPERGLLASQLADALAQAKLFADTEPQQLSGELPWPRSN